MSTSEQSRTTGLRQELLHLQRSWAGRGSGHPAELLPACPSALLCYDGHAISDTQPISSTLMFPCEEQGSAVDLQVVN